MSRRGELLVDRDIELAALARVAAQAADELGGLAVVEGPAGIGKSRLLNAHRAQLRERGVRVLVARGGELEADVPFGVVRQLFERALIADGNGLLSGAAHAAAPIFSGVADDGPAPADPGPRILHGLWWLCANLAADGPLVLHVDDAHWADAPSLRFVDHLSRRLEGTGLALVVAWRSEDPGAVDPLLSQLAADPAAAVLRPGPLGADAVARLAEASFGGPCAPEFVDACHGATRGNPFLLHELLAELSADGVTPDAAAAREVHELGASAVARAVLLRLGAVSPAAVALAHAIAVLGGEAESRRAAAVARLTPEQTATAVDALVALQIVERGQPLQFVHPLVRRSILDDLAPSELAELHARSARVLDAEGATAERVAGHLLGTDGAGDPWVVELLRAGAVRARAQGALDAAARWLTRALAEPPPPELRNDVLVELGLVEMSLGRHVDGRRHLQEALAREPAPAKRARCFPDLAWATMNLDGVPAAVALLEQEIETADALDHETALKLEADLASMGAMSPEVTREVARRLARFATVRGTTRGERLVLASLAQLAWYRNAPAEEVADLARRAWGDGALLGDTSIEDLPAYQVVYALVMADALEDAEAAADRLLAAGSTQGSIITFGAGSGLRAWVRQRRGLLAEAAADGAQGLAALRELGPLAHQQAMTFVGVRGTVEALVARGELEAADAVLQETAFDGDVFDLVPLNRVVGARGLLRLAQGRSDEGIADLRELGARDARAGVVAPGDPWRTAVAGALRAAGQVEEARTLLEEQLTLARAARLVSAEGAALRALALTHDGERRVELLEQAVALLSRAPSRLEEAAALTDLGAALRVAGRRSAATEPLTRALELAAGVPPLARRAHEELETAGARPRRLRFSGAEDLTAAERRVAELAGDGRSNREIAQELFVTPKTVENHLGRIYMKLGIHSRRELSAALVG
ncbi:AAA family ATPase [Conexibacter stalactiti]|uniref:AAA family ATPase n=1 Tax=Conexibacter stalactiti TaxID=1940611 RepID=A0ABU4HK91_9ACTN|nr:AAA family ATPase [Conexibacter stalactiti]MDW5593725.1 AAA family ATPase [Conexibacter stalactiti]MEC5034366.1 AAA family ATPase [Conexibacter stalactiti]